MNFPLHTLGEHIQLLQKHGLLAGSPSIPFPERTVALVSCDSQNVVPNTLFICKGAHFKEQYLRDAIAKGAFVYLAASPYENISTPCIPVTDVRRAMALLAGYYYDHPSRKLNVTGITGTKGKSTTSYYLKYIFDSYMSASGGKESGIIGSIETYDGVEHFGSHLTTPEPLDLERHLANAVGTGQSYLTMEVSSQALKYDRVLGVELAAACFLNIGLDHISPIEHPDFQDYFQSKLKIFEQAAVGCVNLDMDYAGDVLAAARTCARVITFSQKDPAATVFASQVHKSGNDILFRVKTPRFLRQFRLTMPGLFNVENALAAIAVCEALGIPEEHIYAGLERARVPGRMEIYSSAGDEVIAIVDFAHNQMSFEKLFGSVRSEYPDRRVVTVFGCPGDKALDRRQSMGEIAGRYSDLVILSEDDPGGEDPEDICRQIAVHVEGQGCQYSIRLDRGEAVRQAILGCREPSVVLVAGRGVEAQQKRGLDYIDSPLDSAYVQDALQEYDAVHGLDGLERIRSFLEVLPAAAAWSGKTIVVQFDAPVSDSILQDAAALFRLGARVVLVHRDSKAIVSALGELGTQAVGLSSQDGGLLTVQSKDSAPGAWETVSINTALLDTLLDGGFLPVLSPPAGVDNTAQAVAEALGADSLLYFTNFDGVPVDCHSSSTVIPHIGMEQGRELLDSGLIAEDMAPKVRGCLQAVERGVGKAVLLNGAVEHALLLDAAFPKSLGTTLMGA